jgi:hypothetical protein
MVHDTRYTVLHSIKMIELCYTDIVTDAAVVDYFRLHFSVSQKSFQS